MEKSWMIIRWQNKRLGLPLKFLIILPINNIKDYYAKLRRSNMVTNVSSPTQVQQAAPPAPAPAKPKETESKPMPPPDDTVQVSDAAKAAQQAAAQAPQK